jgi:hypothetical protein
VTFFTREGLFMDYFEQEKQINFEPGIGLARR